MKRKSKTKPSTKRIFAKKRGGLEPIPTLTISGLVTFDLEKIQPVREEVNGKQNPYTG